GKEYKEALGTVVELFEENLQYTDFLSTFAIPLEERLNALETAFSDKIPRDVLSFLKLLCEKRHIGEFSECVEEYNTMYNEICGISNAKVTSAVELSKNEKASLVKKLEKMSGKKTLVEYTVDKSIIGGLIVETDGKIIDSSLRKHLNDVKDVVSK
ncbi:MAG: ATP synthase F1 subunit delta, partial [Clostridia bacterium]|nr:ATP synthase F1 subunit delta [Clostridia bacterium]